MRSVVLLPVVAVTALWAQPCTYSLRGHVYDRDSGRALPGQIVQATEHHRETATVRKAVTDPEGYFEFPDLHPTLWRVSIEQKGHWFDRSPDSLECGGSNFYISGSLQRETNRATAVDQACKFALRGYVYYHESFSAMPGHVVRATNGNSVATAVANRNGYFEFLNLTSGNWWLTTDMVGFKPAALTQFATLRADTGCANRNLYLQRFGPREQLEEAVQSVPGYAVAFYQLVLEAFGARRP